MLLEPCRTRKILVDLLVGSEARARRTVPASKLPRLAAGVRREAGDDHVWADERRNATGIGAVIKGRDIALILWDAQSGAPCETQVVGHNQG